MEEHYAFFSLIDHGYRVVYTPAARVRHTFPQTEAELRALIRRLRPEQQHLLALRYGAGLTFQEIGAIFDSAPATVRVRMHRILEDLRRRYPHDDA